MESFRQFKFPWPQETKSRVENTINNSIRPNFYAMGVELENLKYRILDSSRSHISQKLSSWKPVMDEQRKKAEHMKQDNGTAPKKPAMNTSPLHDLWNEQAKRNEEIKISKLYKTNPKSFYSYIETRKNSYYWHGHSPPYSSSVFNHEQLNNPQPD